MTASIIRLFSQLAWEFPHPRAPPANKLDVLIHGVHGIDVLGQRWRVLTAAAALMFAFAERISTAPVGGGNSSVKVEGPGRALVQTSISRRAIQEAEPSSEVD